MSTIPVVFRASPLPSNFAGSPQDLLDAFVSRLSIDSPTTLSFFVSGPTAPSSDVGAWLKNGTTWYIWDILTGAYIPQKVDFASLKYIWQSAAPDQNLYTFWGKLDGGGKAQSIQFFSSGAWHDVYEDTFALYSKTVDMTAAISAAVTAGLVPYSTTALMNAAISAAVAAAPNGKGVFRVYMSGTQVQPIAVSNSGDVTPVYDIVALDPDSCFSGNKYTCPANGYYYFNATLQVAGNDNHVTDLYLILTLLKNAGVGLAGAVHGSPLKPDEQRSEAISFGPFLLNAGDTVYINLQYSVTVNAPSGFTMGGGGPASAQWGGWMIRGAS